MWGRRIIIGAAVATLIIAASHAQPTRDRDGGNTSAARSDHGAAENASVAASARRIAGALEAQQRETDSGKRDEDERERRDLKAQEDMADWAQAMFWAAFAQAILSAVGIVLIFVTFKEARRAADSGDRMAEEAVKATSAAIEASNAGREANAIAKTTSELQLRPWLIVKARVETDIDYVDETMKFTVALDIKNVGSTIARNIMSDSLTYPDAGSIPNDFPNTMYETAARVQRWGDILVPGEEDTLRFLFEVPIEPDECGYMAPIIAFTITYNSDDGTKLYESSPFYALYNCTYAPYRRFKVGTAVLKQFAVLKRLHGRGRAS